ncbi:MAG: polyketide cyclase [Chitinophagaceae bacterium]|nr:MAG: polyketide cyclase [Chitinophagaceae bacterium]
MVSETNQTAEAGMMIRQPASVVYQAFIDPEITTKFWFTKSTGRLDQNETLTWTWEMYNVSTEVIVESLEPNKKISILWGGPGEKTHVDWTFTSLDGSRTFVHIKNHGFKGTLDEIISQVRDSTGGFTTVLDGLKAYLEHNIQLNLVSDKFPEEISEHGNQGG